ncbi:MAG: secretion protein HlyD family protein [Verrucomicrobiales bacterium]|nr:secretion protein HlyD family protein [Verrucomicrobiales bacterium]
MSTFETNSKESQTQPVAPSPEQNPQVRPLGSDNAAPPLKPPGKRRRWVFFILGLIALLAAVYGIRTIIFHSGHVQTDDAQVEGHISPVIPQVPGYVTQVLVDDNQRVEAGQVVVRIDPREIEARLRTAEAALQTASATLREGKASAEAAQARRERAVSDFERQEKLFQAKTSSPQEYEAAKSAANAAAASYRAAQGQTSAAEATVTQRQADLDYAKLQLSFTTLKAPVSGIVSRRTVELGQYVQVGQPLLAVVNDGDLWVVANYKETQLKKIRVGQPVTITVDAYPKVEFRGKVDSFASATGARFSILPPENASGNFVKVVQRIPIKIVFDRDDKLRQYPLRIGMNVVPTIIVK